MAKAVDLFLNDFSKHKDKAVSADTLGCFCWNVRNPSIKTAIRQVLWLKEQPFDILALTETKDSEGCNYVENYFKARGFHVLFPKPPEDEYGAMVISRFPFEKGFLFDFGSSRVNSVRSQDFEFVNAYIPNNRESGKKEFLNKLANSLKSAPKQFVFCGDLNIIEPDHVPHYSKFEAWEYDFYRTVLDMQLHDAFRIINPKANEYSWIGRTGDGYRYDHCFVSEDLVSKIHECYYVHEPRLKRLSDHSGLVLSIKF
ncbi:Uncharacterised protein [uncultured archaeon]|nr:Uncharacterised protein [uncultured archaeon]